MFVVYVQYPTKQDAFFTTSTLNEALMRYTIAQRRLVKDCKYAKQSGRIMLLSILDQLCISSEGQPTEVSK